MHILCTICSDLVHGTENIQVTQCGHIFHHHCLSQWIARSKSCPQCRNKVTDKTMFRLYPTISNENSGEDVTTLQSRLDDAKLQLREHNSKFDEQNKKLAVATEEVQKNAELLKSLEKTLVVRESAIQALKEQLNYVKIQNKETNRLKEENESLKKNLQTLNGLQKVLNATSSEVEQMLEGYSDARTMATFATALKRALCESESKKNESRDRIQSLRSQLQDMKNTVADLQAKLIFAEDKITSVLQKYQALKSKRKASEVDRSIECEKSPKLMRPSLEPDSEPSFNDAIILNESNTSLSSMVNRIENADSPYLSLRQSSLALAALQRHPSHPLPNHNLKPSEFAILNSARNAVMKRSDSAPASQKLSILHKKQPLKMEFARENQNTSELNISYDGLGGHSKLDTFPVPKLKPIKLSAKHKLKRPTPAPAGSQDISKLLEKIRDK